MQILAEKISFHKMKFAQFILLIIIIALLSVIIFLMYNLFIEINAESEQLITTGYNSSGFISYYNDSQFYPNMRFTSSKISYKIDSSCNSKKTKRVKEAFLILEGKTGLKFYSTEANEEISILCNENDNIEKGEYFIAGEGGPVSIVNVSLFNIIEKGKVLLFYEKSACENSNIELHEILHVFGFKHSENKDSIMYAVSYCNQNISVTITNELKNLYLIEQLPDLYFNSASAVKTGSYLDFTVDVRNQGLIIAKNVSLDILKKGKKVKSFDIGSLDYGEGKIISIGNLKVGSDADQIKFSINYLGRELEKKNNVILLAVSD